MAHAPFRTTPRAILFFVASLVLVITVLGRIGRKIDPTKELPDTEQSEAIDKQRSRSGPDTAYAVRKQKRQEQLLTQLAQTSAEDFEERKRIYGKLDILFPDSAVYEERYRYYKTKLEEREAAATREKERRERIKAQFSAWDGSHKNLELYIKARMNDPGSFEHVETVYYDMGEFLTVIMTFRGKNVFGGVVTNTIRAKVDLDGNILEVSEMP